MLTRLFFSLFDCCVSDKKNRSSSAHETTIHFPLELGLKKEQGYSDSNSAKVSLCYENIVFVNYFDLEL